MSARSSDEGPLPRRAGQPRGAPPHLSPAKGLLFSAVVLLLVLLGIEGAVRLYLFVRSAGSPEEPRGYVMDDAEAGYTLKPGYDAGGIRIDSLGFRGPEVRSDRASGVLRIAALGDSATFGPHEEECAYPYLLPAQLAPRPVEAINAAVEGYRTDRALVRLRKDVLPLRPDLVVVFLGWNDLYQTDPRAESEQLSIRGNPLAQLLTASEAAQTFRRLYFLRLRSASADPTAVSVGDARLLASYQPAGYAERLRAIFRTARAGGAQVVTLTWPTVLSDSMSAEAIARVHYPWYTNQLDELRALYARYQETQRRVAAEEGVPVVDVAAAFDGHDSAALFKDTAHFTCEGQALVAERLADYVKALPAARRP